MPRIVVVFDMRCVDEDADARAVEHLCAGRDGGPAEVTVLSVVDMRQYRRPWFVRFFEWGGSLRGVDIGPLPADHDVYAEAGYRMDRMVAALRARGCAVDGLVSDEDVPAAVRRETAARRCDEVVLITDPGVEPSASRLLRRDAAHRLRRRFGDRLTTLSAAAAYPPVG